MQVGTETSQETLDRSRWCENLPVQRDDRKSGDHQFPDTDLLAIETGFETL